VLTRRSAEFADAPRPGQLSGGRMDEGEDAPTAALREAPRGDGLDPSAVGSSGGLSPLFTLNAASFVLPWWVCSPSARLLSEPDEVARVFDVELADLVGDGAYHEETWDPYEEWSATGPSAADLVLRRRGRSGCGGHGPNPPRAGAAGLGMVRRTE